MNGRRSTVPFTGYGLGLIPKCEFQHAILQTQSEDANVAVCC